MFLLRSKPLMRYLKSSMRYIQLLMRYSKSQMRYLLLTMWYMILSMRCFLLTVRCINCLMRYLQRLMRFCNYNIYLLKASLFFQQIRSEQFSPFYRLLVIPFIHFGLMTRKQYVGHFPTVVFCRTSINRRCQQIVLKRIGEC